MEEDGTKLSPYSESRSHILTLQSFYNALLHCTGLKMLFEVCILRGYTLQVLQMSHLSHAACLRLKNILNPHLMYLQQYFLFCEN